MTVRRISPRDERRRRALVEERLASAPAPTATAPAARAKVAPSTRYTPAARAEHQPRVSELLPLRAWTVLVWFLVGLSVVVAHATLYTCYLRWHHPALRVDLSAFDLEGPRNLTRWTASCLLLAASLLAVHILRLRRHRIDDYRARYRLWYYVAVLLVLGSMDTVAGLHRVVYSVADAVARQFARPVPWSLLAWLLVLVVAGLTVRLLFEVRASRGATASIAGAGLAYLASAAACNGWWTALPSHLLTLTAGLTLLLGHYLLVMSLVVYSRYVHLDAQGRLPQVEARGKLRARRLRWRFTLPWIGSRSKAEAADATDDAKPTKTRSSKDSDTKPTPSPPAKETAAPPSSVTPAPEAADDDVESDDDDADESPDTLQISRSERRRLKKQHKRDRRAA